MDLNEARDDEVLGCSGISWTICKQSAPRSRQITTSTSHHSIFAGRILFLMPNQQCQNTHTHTHMFNGPFSGNTRLSRHQKGKTSLGFTEARDSESQWHQLGHMQVCTSRQHPITQVFYRPDALTVTQPTASKHCHVNGHSCFYYFQAYHSPAGDPVRPASLQ